MEKFLQFIKSCFPPVRRTEINSCWNVIGHFVFMCDNPALERSGGCVFSTARRSGIWRVSDPMPGRNNSVTVRFYYEGPAFCPGRLQQEPVKWRGVTIGSSGLFIIKRAGFSGAGETDGCSVIEGRRQPGPKRAGQWHAR
jgi:hypothetical protein